MHVVPSTNSGNNVRHCEECNDVAISVAIEIASLSLAMTCMLEGDLLKTKDRPGGRSEWIYKKSIVR